MNYWTLIFGTILIVVFSWKLSVMHGRFHGVARFFSFESIFLLTLLNYPYWFLNPLSAKQIASFLLLTLSLVIAVTGFVQLKTAGRPTGGNFENTSRLVSNGLYRYIRHPLYLALFLLGTGIMLKNITITTLLFALLNLVAVWHTASIEEKEMAEKFGEEYHRYCDKTEMFIPFIL